MIVPGDGDHRCALRSRAAAGVSERSQAVDAESHPSKNEGRGTRRFPFYTGSRGERFDTSRRALDRAGSSTPHELHFVKSMLRSG